MPKRSTIDVDTFKIFLFDSYMFSNLFVKSLKRKTNTSEVVSHQKPKTVLELEVSIFVDVILIYVISLEVETLFIRSSLD